MSGHRFADYGKQARRAAQLLGRWSLSDLKAVADALRGRFPFSDGRAFDVFDVGKQVDRVLTDLYTGAAHGVALGGSIPPPAVDDGHAIVRARRAREAEVQDAQP
jgi:hypothetical protein